MSDYFFIVVYICVLGGIFLYNYLVKSVRYSTVSRKKAVRVEGEVIACDGINNSNNFHTVIEFYVNGHPFRCVDRTGSNLLDIGQRVFVYYDLRDPRNSVMGSPIYDDGTIECHLCRSNIPSESVVCPKCGVIVDYYSYNKAKSKEPYYNTKLNRIYLAPYIILLIYGICMFISMYTEWSINIIEYLVLNFSILQFFYFILIVLLIFYGPRLLRYFFYEKAEGIVRIIDEDMTSIGLFKQWFVVTDFKVNGKDYCCISKKNKIYCDIGDKVSVYYSPKEPRKSFLGIKR